MSKKSPISWQDLYSYHSQKEVKNYNKVLRKQAVSETYGKYKKELKVSLSAPIHTLMDKYGCNSIITYNKFPYNIEDGATHLVIWDRRPNTSWQLVHEELLKKIEHFKYKYALFKNTKMAQSIPDLTHYHLIVDNELIPALSSYIFED